MKMLVVFLALASLIIGVNVMVYDLVAELEWADGHISKLEAQIAELKKSVKSLKSTQRVVDWRAGESQKLMESALRRAMVCGADLLRASEALQAAREELAAAIKAKQEEAAAVALVAPPPKVNVKPKPRPKPKPRKRSRKVTKQTYSWSPLAAAFLPHSSKRSR